MRKVHASSAELGDCPHREEKKRLGEWQAQPYPFFTRGKCAHFAREFALTTYLKTGELPPLPAIQEKAIGDVEADESALEEVDRSRHHAEMDAFFRRTVLDVRDVALFRGDAFPPALFWCVAGRDGGVHRFRQRATARPSRSAVSEVSVYGY